MLTVDSGNVIDATHTSGDIHWNFNSNPQAFNFLAAGATLELTYTIRATDSDVAHATGDQTVVIKVTGTNDPAVITGTSTAELTETNAAQSTGGTLSATDVDSSNAFVVQTNVQGDHQLGHFSINAGGTWTYTMDSAHNEFAANTDHTDSVTVATADGTLQVITVTMHGTNDAAVIAGQSTGVVEVADDGPGSGTLTYSGTLTDTDVDNLPNTFTVAAAGSATDHGYGTYEMTAGGVWTYTLNNSNPTVRGLDENQHLTDTFTIHTVDGTAQVVSVTITDNDDPDHDVYAVDGLTLLTRSTAYISGNNHNFVGDSAPNTIIGNNDSTQDHINGKDGDDTIYGRGGADDLQGGGGNDTIYAGSGNDTINGGPGADQVWGGSGRDTFVFSAATESTPVSFDTIHDFQVGVDHIDVRGLGFSASASGLGDLAAHGINWSQVGSDTVISGDTNGNPANAEFKIVLTGVTATTLHLTDFILT
jgi:VCBS repeat-containing protein